MSTPRTLVTAALAVLAGSMALAGPAVASTDPRSRVGRREVAAGSGPSGRSFPLLGASADRRVRVEWNRLHDHASLGSILRQLHGAFPELTELYSLGKSHDGRELWCLEVTARRVGDPKRKPGMYIDGNVHGNEVQGAEAVAYTAWYLCHQYGHLERVTALLDRRVFYLVPTINPDGRDSWLHEAHTASSSRTGVRPHDNDRDGLLDEDGPDDLDGDGHVTRMRIRDPQGRWKAHPDHPEYLMVRAAPDEPGEFTLLGYEGIDNDGDGRINEDGPGGYDPNRDWAWDWQPGFVQYGAREYPFSLPESRAVAEFVLAHPNIAAMQSYHNSGGMILHGPGREGGTMHRGDESVLEAIAARGEKMLPYYRSMVVWKDLYTVWGGEFDWFYGARGILGFSNELWTGKNLFKTADGPSREDEAAFLKYVLLDDGVVPWRAFDHPTYGPIEIGGTEKEWGRTPVSFLLEEECHRNMAFTLHHADMMPLLEITSVDVEPIASGLYKVWVTIANHRLIPTRTEQDVANHVSPPDVVTLEGRGADVLSAGRVTDRFFDRVEPVERRPHRVELERIAGMSAERVQFIVGGRGRFTVTVDSAKGGVLKADGELR